MPRSNTWILIALLASPLVPASSGLQATPTKAPITKIRPIELRVQGRFPAKLRFQVSSALEKADHRLQARSACRELFQIQGADGSEVLHSAYFLLPESDHHHSICTEHSAAAFTTVGGSETYLCPALFGELSVNRAAVILLHEALHQAGMSEWPADPSGLKSTEINQLIRHHCAL